MARDEYLLGQVCELLFIATDQHRDRVPDEIVPGRGLIPFLYRLIEYPLDGNLREARMDLREHAEGLDNHQRHDPGGYLMAQLLGEVEDQQPLTNPRERNLERLGDSLARVTGIFDEDLIAERLLKHVQGDAESVGEHRVQQVSTRHIRACLDQRGYEVDLRLLGGTPAPLAVDDLVVALLLGRLDEDRMVNPRVDIACASCSSSCSSNCLRGLFSETTMLLTGISHSVYVPCSASGVAWSSWVMVGILFSILVSQARLGGGPCATLRATIGELRDPPPGVSTVRSCTGLTQVRRPLFHFGESSARGSFTSASSSIAATSSIVPACHSYVCTSS